MQTIKIVQEDKKEIPTEVIASSIIKISEGIRELNNGRLNSSAIVALLYDSTKVPKKTINKILSSLADLEKTWLKVKK